MISLGNKGKSGKPPNTRYQLQQAFILEKQIKLLQFALATWPRRSAPLLEVNCGSGAFLPVLWQSGFETRATEFDADLRLKALSRPVPDLEIRSAKDDDLPFEDDAFDWVILNLRPDLDTDIKESAREALRVARRGLMITFWNSASLALLLGRISRKKRNVPTGLSCFKVLRLLRQMGENRYVSLATLCGPWCTWSKSSRLAFINDWLTGLPIGAWCIVRVDLGTGYPHTSLPLRIGGSLSNPEPAMEYSNKNLSTNHKDNIRQ